MDLHIMQATAADREFVIHANREIDSVSGIANSALSENVDKDVFDERQAICLVAKDGRENVGMLLFSKVYWADRGQGVYVSQGFVEEKARGKGVFKAMLKEAYDFYPETKFVTLLVAQENQPMRQCVTKMGFELEDMMSFVRNKDSGDKQSQFKDGRSL